MKKKSGFGLARKIFAVFIFLVGFVLVMYPMVSNYWNAWRDKRLINTYQAVIEKEDDTKIQEMLEAAREYNSRNIHVNTFQDAFAKQESINVTGESETEETELSEADAEYMSLLNLNGDGVMGYLEIPKIEIRLPIFHGTSEEVLETGVGHLQGTSLPVGGESTHSVMAAHRGLPAAALFTDLNLMENGDLFFLYILGETLAYEVDSVLVVDPDDTDSLAIIPGEDLVTLVTCTPYGVNSHRLLVRGHRTEYDPEVYEEAAGQTTRSLATNYILIVGGAMGIVLLVALILIKRRKKMMKNNEK